MQPVNPTEPSFRLEEPLPEMKRVSIAPIARKYGLYISIVSILFILTEYLLGFHNQHFEIGTYTGYLAIILPIALFWFGIREVKALYPNEKLPLSKGIAFSALSSFIAGILLGGFMFVYIKWINPEFVQISAELQAAQLRAQGFTEEQIIAALTNLFILFHPLTQAVVAFLGALIQGCFIGTIITFIQRRRI